MRTHLRNVDLLDVQAVRHAPRVLELRTHSDQGRGEHAALRLWGEMFGMETAGISFNGSRCAYEPTLNPSSHLSHENVAEVLDRVRPEILIGVHCERPELLREVASEGVQVERTIRL